MSLSTAVSRRHMSTRRTHSEGYRRDDGLWDIESHIIDTKTYTYTEPCRGARPPGSEVHHMAFRLTVDAQMVVRSLEISMPSTPYPSCDKALGAYQALVGQSLARGWRRAVQDVAGGARGCTHLSELLIAAASTAFQAVQGWPEPVPGQPPDPIDPRVLDRLVDSCVGLRAGGEGAAHVLKFYPKT